MFAAENGREVSVQGEKRRFCFAISSWCINISPLGDKNASSFMRKVQRSLETHIGEAPRILTVGSFC
jgi:hypothetical protein